MNFDWQFVEVAALLNLAFAGLWKLREILRTMITNLIDIKIALLEIHLDEKFATKEEVPKR
jgi:hypothetical protein